MDPEPVLHALRTTRSVRRKLDFERPVAPELIEACIDVATQAPTGLDRENWRFLVVTDPEKKRAIGELYRRAFGSIVAELSAAEPPPDAARFHPGYRELADHLHRVPVLILVCALGSPDRAEPARQVGFYGSILPAAWSLMVALRAQGLGATWTTLLVREAARVAELLDIPEGVTQTVLLPVAYTKGARLRPAGRKPAAEVSYWNGWGRRR